MIRKRLIRPSTKKSLVGSILGVVLSALIISGCTVGSGLGYARGGESSGGEHGAGGEGSNEGDGSETGEAAMSSPIIPLGQSWSGVLGGLAVSMQYDPATQSVYGTVRNTLSQRLCYVQAEPHLKSGTKTVGELGPEKLGDLNPGQQVTSRLSAASEPSLAGVSYDGYVVHMEVFDCGGPSPMAHTESGEEGGGASLAPDDTFDTTRSGARLILSYHAPSNSFRGTVENTTNGVLRRVRIEVHLSNGAELGPTTPTDMAPGKVIVINLPATQASFTGWTAHAEVGSGGEGGGEGGESGEHGAGGEGGGEHGSGGEHRDGD